MMTFKTINRVMAACGLTLVAASFAQAQSPTTATSSTDIYTTDFQSTFATGSVIQKDRLQWRLPARPTSGPPISRGRLRRTSRCTKRRMRAATGVPPTYGLPISRRPSCRRGCAVAPTRAPHSRRRSASIETARSRAVSMFINEPRARSLRASPALTAPWPAALPDDRRRRPGSR